MSRETSLTVEPGGPLRGRIRVPGDKSISHRALLLAASAAGTSTVQGLSTGDDVARTAIAVQALGAHIDGVEVTGGPDRLREPDAVIDVGNSGTGIRLLAGFVAAFPWLTVLTGDRSIAGRPMGRVVEPLRAMGATVDGRRQATRPPLVVRGGGLRAVEYTVPVPSAQVKSAVLLAALGAEGETIVHEAFATRPHTEELLARAGVAVETTTAPTGAVTIRLAPGPLRPFDIDIPGDPSQAAFWIVAATVVPGSEVTVENVYVGATRAGFVDVLRRMGADIEVESRSSDATVADITVRHSGLRATEVEGREIPGLDEIPILAVAAAAADGDTMFRDVGELRVKESDRVATIASELGRLGAAVEAGPDHIVVRGGRPLTGAAVESHGDHRIAMSAAIAALVASGPTTISGWDAVATSYPRFEEVLSTCR